MVELEPRGLFRVLPARQFDRQLRHPTVMPGRIRSIAVRLGYDMTIRRR
jgi:hypothetical protein